jgi:hypothetical protein
MLGDCGAWYNRFVDEFAADSGKSLGELDALTLTSDLNAVRRVLHDDENHKEEFSPAWEGATLGERVACTQFSIALELLLRVKCMLGEVSAAGVPRVETYVLTGGLSQSEFFQHIFHTGIKLLDREARVKVSGRTGPLRYKTSAYGALINAELPRVGGSLAAFHESGNRFPLIDCAAPDSNIAAHLRYLLQSYGA